MENGLVHIYTGDGKGKTTASVGLAVRCRGAGRQVLFVQFMKGMATGELAPLRRLGIDVMRRETVKKFLFAMTEQEKEIFREDNAFCFRWAVTNAEKYDLVVLDEIMSAVSTGMLPVREVEEFLKNKPAALEVAMTGRNPDPRLLPYADYISEIVMRRHPYEKGIQARPGIEY